MDLKWLETDTNTEHSGENGSERERGAFSFSCSFDYAYMEFFTQTESFLLLASCGVFSNLKAHIDRGGYLYL